jgi:hypothetical protein
MVFGIGPFQGPAGVAWGGGKIAVLEVASQCSNRNDANFNPLLRDMPFGGSFGLHSAATVRFPEVGPFPPVTQVITPAMKGFYQMWSYPLFSERTTTIDPGGSVTSYYVWYDFGDPFPGVEPFLFENNISFDSVWDNFADAQARASSIASHHVEEYTLVTDPFTTYFRDQKALVFFNLSKISQLATVDGIFHFELEYRAPAASTESIAWQMRLRTYKGESTFAANAENETLWAFPASDTFEHDEDSGEGMGATFTVDVDIDIETLQITGEVTES